MPKLTDLLPAPADSEVNGNATPCPTSFLVRKYGMPRATLTNGCLPPTAVFWASRMVTASVGPFRVTGHRKAVVQLTIALAEVRRLHPELYAALGTAGMLCCRKVRGGTMPSNHSLGLAIDFTIAGVLDPYGDGKVQRGLFLLYSILKKYGFYWGVEFGKEDAMHFEVSAETVMQWVREGSF